MRTAWSAAPAMLLLTIAACTGGEPAATSPTPSSPAASPAGATSPATAPTPTAPAQLTAALVAAGDQHACALDREGHAWCWGYNQAGQLGDGTTTIRNAPVAVVGDTAFTTLTAGRYFTCGLTESRQALCWGDNSRGQLGDGTTGAGSDQHNRSSPAAVTGDLAFTALVAGQQHACGLVDSGQAYCWGAYASGQLGTRVTEDQAAPVRAAGELTFASLAPGGDSHGCALTDGGAAWCWGSNAFGQLGDGTKTNAPQPDPREVAGPQTFTVLALGGKHTCALGEDGAVWCWGDNRAGQLGDGTTTERLTPTLVDSSLRFVRVTAGQQHTCALTADGEAMCWGHNGFGQLGTGEDAGTSLTPVAVTGGIGFTALSAGEEFTCGLDTAGAVFCWGSNRAGWLGTGSDERSPVPAPVAAP